jgi:hypothetical protein
VPVRTESGPCPKGSRLVACSSILLAKASDVPGWVVRCGTRDLSRVFVAHPPGQQSRRGCVLSARPQLRLGVERGPIEPERVVRVHGLKLLPCERTADGFAQERPRTPGLLVRDP